MVNTLCQGSAADLIKRAMLAIDAELLARAAEAEGGGAGGGGEGGGGGGGGAGSTMHLASTGRLLLQVHDELIFEVTETQLLPITKPNPNPNPNPNPSPSLARSRRRTHRGCAPWCAAGCRRPRSCACRSS